MIIVSFAFSYKRSYLYDVWLVMDVDNDLSERGVSFKAYRLNGFFRYANPR